MPQVPTEPIRHLSEFQPNWASLVPPLRRDRHSVESTAELAIHGEAPKCFIHIREYRQGSRPTHKPARWAAYIAKVGSKDYPNESITEHLLTRVGQALDAKVADSRLCYTGRQVRFLSKYFLDRDKELLVHGIEIFRVYLEDDEIVNEVARCRREAEFYTFQTISEAIGRTYPEASREIVADLVEMIAFDALVGHNDRHPANWGVIAPLSRRLAPRFSPIFDTARALFWNNSERTVARIAADHNQMNAYIRRSHPQIGWDGWDNPKSKTHFDLLREIRMAEPGYYGSLAKFLPSEGLERCCKIVEEEFAALMSATRRRVIIECLRRRHAEYVTTVG